MIPHKIKEHHAALEPGHAYREQPRSEIRIRPPEFGHASRNSGRTFAQYKSHSISEKKKFSVTGPYTA